MKSFFAGMLSILFLLPTVLALPIQDYTIVFDIQPNGNVRENITIVFAEPLNESTLNYVVLGEVSDLAIRSGGKSVDYVLEKRGNEWSVKFLVPEHAETLEIEFVAKDLVFAKENVYGFFANLQPPRSEKVNILAFLPRGFAVYRDVVYPEGYETLTDGERIYLKWELESPEEVMISFKFYNLHSDYSIFVLIIMGFSLLAITLYLVTYYRRKVKTEFLRGFSDDEIEVLNILSERKVCMQNKLEKELGFSRAKMTRIMKKLEGKGLVERERIGRTNRICWKRSK